jgi:exosome complex component RRP45
MFAACEVAFVRAALGDQVRQDGRGPLDCRKLVIRLGQEYGEAEVRFGRTRVLSVVTAQLVEPPADRPSEGKLQFHVEFGPMAAAEFEVGRPSAEATMVCNVIERLLKGSRSIDTEALCVVAGEKAWSVRVDVHVLNHDGNLTDACALAAVVSLLHFRKKDVEVRGKEAKVYGEREREPVPLNLHHLPVPVSFGVLELASKELGIVMDPTSVEERALRGTLMLAVNQYGELCGMHKPGGMPMTMEHIRTLVNIAKTHVIEVQNYIRERLEADKKEKKAFRRNVHQKFKAEDLVTVEPLMAAEPPAAFEPPAREDAAAAPAEAQAEPAEDAARPKKKKKLKAEDQFDDLINAVMKPRKKKQPKTDEG